MIAGSAPTLDDFASQRNLNPDKHFDNVDECTAHAVSLWGNVERCRRLMGLPAHASKRIAAVTLLEGAGGVARTGKQRDHFSWWRCAAYDTLSQCTVIP